jgi:hypothetical protein
VYLFRLFLPIVKIHTWGGLGSQLYALALSIDLGKNVSNRDIQFVIHSSGITRRAPEIEIYSDKVKFKDDFSASPKADSLTLNSFEFIKKQIKLMLIKLGVYAYCNSDAEVISLKRWVLAIRGHYTNRTLSSATISKVYSRVKGSGFIVDSEFTTNSLAIHYRLGDLETLGYKSPIKAERFIGLIEDVMSKNTIEKIYVYSDSPDIAIKKLKVLSPSLNLIQRDLPPIDSVIESTQTTFFIGSNSKLSIWITLFRAVQTQSKSSYLPREMKHMLDRNLGELFPRQITFY